MEWVGKDNNPSIRTPNRAISLQMPFVWEGLQSCASTQLLLQPLPLLPNLAEPLCCFPGWCCQGCFHSFYCMLARWTLSWHQPKRTDIPRHNGARFPPKCLSVVSLPCYSVCNWVLRSTSKKTNFNPKGWFIYLDDEDPPLNYLISMVHWSFISAAMFSLCRKACKSCQLHVIKNFTMVVRPPY